VLLLPRGAVLAGPVAVVYEGAAGSEAALAAGARLAEILRDELLVLGVAPSAETARAALQAAERWFARREPPPPHRSVACPGDLRGALAGQRKGMLVASASSPWVEGQRPHGLLEDLELPLLLVR
jgi:hypothetical protein